MVTYNGQTTNFSGVGSPNPQKLVIPGKDKMTPVDRAAALAIEQWCNNLVSPESGAYASLTGPGETTTPGALTQAGGFTVDDSTGENIILESTATVGIAGANIGLEASADIDIAATDEVSINGGTGLQLQSSSSEKIGFLGTAPVVKPTVTGSRGGNAALASFLTAVADYGLIVDSTTA